MAITRERLLQSAWDTFKEVGYEAAKIDRISERAGYTRGAFYKNWSTKVEVYVELLTIEGARLAPSLLEQIDASATKQEVIHAISTWADERHLARDIGFLLIEVVQHIRRSNSEPADMVKPIRDCWFLLGKSLERFFEGGVLPAEPTEIGALVLELAHAPIVEGMGGPSSGRLVSIALEAMLR